MPPERDRREATNGLHLRTLRRGAMVSLSRLLHLERQLLLRRGRKKFCTDWEAKFQQADADQ